MSCCLKKVEHHWLGQGSETYGPGAGSDPPSKIIRPAVSLPNRSNCMARLYSGRLLYFVNLPSMQLFVLNTYGELLMKNARYYKCAVCRIFDFRYEL